MTEERRRGDEEAREEEEKTRRKRGREEEEKRRGGEEKRRSQGQRSLNIARYAAFVWHVTPSAPLACRDRVWGDAGID